jgi:hypothetical protein
MAEISLKFEQPGNDETLVLEGGGRHSEVRAFKETSDLVGADVPEHLVAGAVLQRHHAFGYATEPKKLAEIAVGWAEAQKTLDAEGSSPVLYIGGHMEERAAAITAEGASLSFEGRDHNGDAKNMTLPAEAQFTTQDWNNVAGEGPFSVYRPISVLASGNQKDARKFVEHRWATYTLPMPGELVVGQDAIDAYMRARVSWETNAEYGHGIYDAFGFWDSDALLSLAALKKIEVSPNFTARTAKIVHDAGIKAAERILVDGLGISPDDDNRSVINRSGTFHRLSAIDFKASDIDTVEAGVSSAVESAEEASPLIEFVQQTGDVEGYLRDVSGAFMRQLLTSQKPAAETIVTA